MSISKRKLAANRANAQKSTGPTSPEGKGKVLLNAIQHGLCGRFRVLDDENQAEYDDLLRRFLEAEQPADHVERELVAKMARHTWLSERSIRFQEACFLYQPQTPEQLANERQSVGVRVDLDVYVRYQAAHDRAYQRAANELAKRRKDRSLAERGSVSQKRAEAAEIRTVAAETRKQELHKWAVLLAEAKLTSEQERHANRQSAKTNPAGKKEERVAAQKAA